MSITYNSLSRPANVQRSTSTWSMTDAPTVMISGVQPERDYMTILHQTKCVYDQLLQDKHSKLYTVLLQQKATYDAQCDEMARKQGPQAQVTIEFGVRAQQALNQLQANCSAEMRELLEDYQQKLMSMQQALEDKWRMEHGREAAPKPVRNDGPTVACKIYPHKN